VVNELTKQGIHRMLCLVIPRLFILMLVVGLHIMEGYQLVLLIDDFLCQEPKFFISAMHTFVDEFISLPESASLPSAGGFAECFISGTRQRRLFSNHVLVP
jgi:hypothetical protein